MDTNNPQNTGAPQFLESSLNPQPQRKWNKIVWVLIVVVVGLVAGLVVWKRKPVVETIKTEVISQQSDLLPETLEIDPTWKTYTDQTWGFSLLYPPDIEMGVSNPYDGSLLLGHQLISFPEKSPEMSVSIVNYFDSRSETVRFVTDLDEYVHNLKSQKDVVVKNIEINGEKGYQVDFEGDYRQIFLQNQDKEIYKIGFYLQRPELVAIARTFKFITSSVIPRPKIFTLLKDDLMDGECRFLGVQGKYASCTVDISGEGQDVIATVIYNGLSDGSVKARKVEISMTYDGNKLTQKSVTTSWQCATGRGHQDFSREVCN